MASIAAPSLDLETKRMVEDSLDRFVDESYEPSARRARLMCAEVDYRAFWPALAELGVLGLPVSEALGGIGGSVLDVCDALRVLSRGLVLEPLIESAVIAGALLGTGPGAAEATAEAISGDVLAVLVGGRRGDDLRCSQQGAGWQLSGRLRVVPGAAQADVWLIAGVDDAGEPMVLRAAPRDLSVRVQTYRMMDGRGASDIEFAATPLPGAALWLVGAPARAALADARARAVSAYCADAAGAMQCLVKLTGEYLRTREQFGVSIGTFQALQHRYADMHMAALEARSMAREISRSVDLADAPRVEWLRYAAPMVVARCGERVGHEAIQMHGGMGVTDELIVSHYNSRLVVLNKLLSRWSADAQPVGSALN